MAHSNDSGARRKRRRTGKSRPLTNAPPREAGGGTGGARPAPPPAAEPTDEVTHTTYDAAGRISSVSHSGGRTVFYKYYEDGRALTMAYPGWPPPAAGARGSRPAPRRKAKTASPRSRAKAGGQRRGKT